MRAVDTNFLVRMLLGDEPDQTRRVITRLHEGPIFIADTVLLESEWVLRDGRGLSRASVINMLKRVVAMPSVHLRDAEMIAVAFDLIDAGLDFADAMHLAATSPGATFMSFDKRLLWRAAGASFAVEEP